MEPQVSCCWGVKLIQVTKSKCKAHPRTGGRGSKEEQSYSFTFSLISALEKSGWLDHVPAVLSRKGVAASLVQEAGQAAEPV
jgi:hypothetical protein